MEKNTKQRSGKMGLTILAVVLGVVGFACMGVAVFLGISAHNNKTLVVGKTLDVSEISEFYLTRSATTNPPYFQRYVFRDVEGKKELYHEKREGDKVFLGPEDATVTGTIPMTDEEWNEFLSLIEGGTVSVPEEDYGTGGSRPYMTLYRKNQAENDNVREFSGRESGLALEIEALAERLVAAAK